MTWARAEELNEQVEQAFAGIALDGDDFEAPVYRSLDGLFSSNSGTVSFETGEEDAFEEAPVYRSLFSADVPAQDSLRSEEDAAADWLATMPPLVSRQNARGASLALDLGF